MQERSGSWQACSLLKLRLSFPDNRVVIMFMEITGLWRAWLPAQTGPEKGSYSSSEMKAFEPNIKWRIDSRSGYDSWFRSLQREQIKVELPIKTWDAFLSFVDQFKIGETENI